MNEVGLVCLGPWRLQVPFQCAVAVLVVQVSPASRVLCGTTNEFSWLLSQYRDRDDSLHSDEVKAKQSQPESESRQIVFIQ